MRNLKFRKISLILLLSLLLISAGPAAPEALPNTAFIDIKGKGQTYPLSCESRSAADLANFWGIPVDEVAFFNALPKSDNPEKGFVGDVFGAWGQIPPKPYGVHAKPIAKLLRAYGLDAKAQRGMTFNELKAEIAAGRPVIVWVIGHVWSGTPVSYTSSDGETTIVARYEHSMIVYGYDLATVYLIDAGSGVKTMHTIQNFKNSWGVLGNLAVTSTGPASAEPPPTSDTGSSEAKKETYVVQPGDYLVMLAKRWGISWQDLAALNDITYPYIIYPGQVLYTGRSVSSGDPPPDPTATPKPTKAPTKEPAPEPTKKPAKTPKPKTYVVQKGDHLMQIARELGLDWKEIAELNGLTYPYILHPGQVLILPGSGATPEPSPGDGGGSGSDYSGKTYVVQKGDYLVALGRKFGIDWRVLASYNGITYPYIIYPGQVLKIP